MKVKLICFYLIVFSSICNAQNTPLFRQFLANQYLFNPAFVAADSQVSVALAYKSQWQKFDGGPSSEAFTIQSPLRKFNLGLSITSQEAVYLKNSTALATIAYSMPTGKESQVRFGLSAGASTYKLDLDKSAYSNDPTILTAASNRANLSGNFGIVFNSKYAEAGFSFPEIFGAKSVTTFKPFSQLRNQLYSLRIKLQVGKYIRLDPYFIYRVTGDFQNFWEASSRITFKNLVWTGASFRQYSGFAFLVGGRIGSTLVLNYSYELMPTSRSFISTGGHEFHLSFWPTPFFEKIKK